MPVNSDFKPVLEDIQWLRNRWWLGQPDSLSPTELRQASVTLDLLLTQGALGRAWRYFGFAKEPKLLGPDLKAFADSQGLNLDSAVSCVAGGGRQNGIDCAFIGAFRIDHPSTGVPADAPQGFAVCQTGIARRVTPIPGTSPLDYLIEKEWPLSKYPNSVGAIRRGKPLARREVIQYFRNYAGGAHHDFLKGKKPPKSDQYELAKELEGHLKADIRDALSFELLSICQSVGRSKDVQCLTDQMEIILRSE